MRETQRRIRIALAENHMLPGDPLRVFGTHGAVQAALEAEANAAGSAKGPDPTAAKPNETNPFESS
jgi:small conductance mechanosensitive channel